MHIFRLGIMSCATFVVIVAATGCQNRGSPDLIADEKQASPAPTPIATPPSPFPSVEPTTSVAIAPAPAVPMDQPPTPRVDEVAIVPVADPAAASVERSAGDTVRPAIDAAAMQVMQPVPAAELR